MKFTIKRSEWDRGKQFGTNINLYNPTKPEEITNNKCCLGFLSLACGFNLGEIEYKCDLTSLVRVRNVTRFQQEFLKVMKKEGQYITTNDTEMLGEENREAQLTAMFAEDGIEVEFVD